jgi:hypothetical protein
MNGQDIVFDGFLAFGLGSYLFTPSGIIDVDYKPPIDSLCR